MSKPVHILLLFRRLSKSEEQGLLLKKVDEILLLDSAFTPHKEELKAKVKNIGRADIDFTERHINRVQEFAHNPLLNGKSIAEKLSNSGSSDWYYLRFSLFHRSRVQMISADEINHILEEIDPNAEITLYHSKGISEKLINRKINQQSSPPQSKKSLALDFLFNYLFLFAYRSIFGKRARSKSLRSAQKLIIANPFLEQEMIDLETGELKVGDPHLQNVIDLSLDDDEFIYLTQLRPPSLEANHQLKLSSYFRSRKYDKRSVYLEPYLLKAYFSKELKRSNKEINKFFIDVEQSAARGELGAEDEFLMKLLSTLKRTLWLAKWREVGAGKLFDKLNVKNLLAIDEHSLQNRSIIHPARKKGIKTFALQHGAINRANIAYRFIKADEAFKPWPDISFIRGMYTKLQLEKNHYPTGSLELVGHLRTDVIPDLKANANEKAKVVYATQPMPPADAELKHKQLVDFLFLVKAYPNEEFIIKPHPNESEIADYYALAADPRYQNLSIYEGNLYQLLASCKLLITYFSTVGLEAIYFDKEVICLDYEKRDYQGYHADGVAHRVLNGEELINTFQGILSKELITDPQKKRDFIEARAYKIDGKATERLMQKFNS